jgi:hypothetical protein
LPAPESPEEQLILQVTGGWQAVEEPPAGRQRARLAQERPASRIEEFHQRVFTELK